MRKVTDVPVRLRLRVRGAVQGVGFRPRVYGLALELGLSGWVRNDDQGVLIEIEGSSSQVQRFEGCLRLNAPGPSRIDAIEAQPVAVENTRRFVIEASEQSSAPTQALILPDLATCADCLNDIFRPSDRRHRYPFTNCTLCGPRFTIMHELPYDRARTSMHNFAMCAACQAEYDDPVDRRFHAQPNACPDCGPQLTLVDTNTDERSHRDTALTRAIELVTKGQILACLGLGGFHLMVNATDPRAIQRLRARKQRPAKPLAVMVCDLTMAHSLAHIDALEAATLNSPAAPIVLLDARAESLCGDIAPGTGRLGLMLPSTPLHHLLMRGLNTPIVATSGNISDEPMCYTTEQARQRLAEISDVVLTHDRPVLRPMDDSVVQCVDGHVQTLRRARGYAPMPLRWSSPLPAVIAAGGQLKSSIALSVGDNIVVSQHLGDLDSLASRRAFERSAQDLPRIYDTRVQHIACDRHPDYASSLWARDLQKRIEFKPEGEAIPQLVQVGHHHAHLAACLADNGSNGPALGVIWDGAGLGDDGTTWGGEFLLGDLSEVRRVAHLRPFDLPGGDAAAREPARMALALLHETLGDEVFDRQSLAPLQALSKTERRVLAQMLTQGTRSPRSTSAGRLFDAVASLLNLCHHASFEGEAAMLLEARVDGRESLAYPLPLIQRAGNPVMLDWAPMLEAILLDIKEGQTPARIATRFHQSLAVAITAVAIDVASPRVALSGGCFQNRALTKMTLHALRKAGFEVLTHRQIPPNDGGLAVGQLLVAASRLGHNAEIPSPAFYGSRPRGDSRA